MCVKNPLAKTAFTIRTSRAQKCSCTRVEEAVSHHLHLPLPLQIAQRVEEMPRELSTFCLLVSYRLSARSEVSFNPLVKINHLLGAS